MRFYSKILLIQIILLMSQYIKAQECEIHVKIEGLKDSVLYLGKHYGESNYIVDTIKINKKNIGIIQRNKKYKSGIYLIILANKKYFEFLMVGNQKFSITTNVSNLLANLNFQNSKENELFNNYQKNIISKNKKLKRLKTKLEEYNTIKDSVDNIKARMEFITQKTELSLKNTIEDNQNTLLSDIIKAMTPVEMPEKYKDAKGNIVNSMNQYIYARKHYFDNINFSDSGLIRTPILENKLKYYIEKVIPQIPDSIILETEKIIEITKINSEMNEYVCSYLMTYFDLAGKMGLDRVFVTIAEKYYLTGNLKWVDSKLMAKIQKRVQELKPSMLYAKAPDLKRIVNNIGEYTSLYNIEAQYTILIFWEPNCGHCKKEIPKLYKMYDDLKKNDIEVMAFYTQNDKKLWLKFIEAHNIDDWINVFDEFHFSDFRIKYAIDSTPSIFLLDQNKKIIAKNIDVSTLEHFLKKRLKK